MTQNIASLARQSDKPDKQTGQRKVNTKTDGISTELVAVAWIHRHQYYPARADDIAPGYCAIGWTHEDLVRRSDAEAIIADLEALVTAENQRKQQLEALIAEKDSEIARLERDATDWLNGSNTNQAIIAQARAFEQEYQNECANLAERIQFLEQCLSEAGASKSFGDQICEAFMRIRELEKNVSASEDLMEMHCAKVRNQGERITTLEAQNERLRKDVSCWRDLVSHQKFNNVPAVGYAINRVLERVANAAMQEGKK